MGSRVHAVKTADGWRYRLWQNTSDTYCNAPMTEADFNEWYLRWKLRQAELYHKSRIQFELRDARNVERDDWETETDHSER